MKTAKRERWAWIPGFEGRYEASNLSRIRSHCQPKLRILKPQPTGVYLTVGLLLPATHYKNGKVKTKAKAVKLYVHRCVLCAFKGEPYSSNHVARHLNGDPSDNSIENLEWGTRAQNADDHYEKLGRPRKTPLRHPNYKESL